MSSSIFPSTPPSGTIHRGPWNGTSAASEPGSLYLERLRRDGDEQQLIALADLAPWLKKTGEDSIRDVETAPGDREHFWEVAGEIGAWDWQGDFGPLVCDGYTWALEMRRKGRAMNCQGHDLAGPPDGLPRLLLALEALAGRGFLWGSASHEAVSPEGHRSADAPATGDIGAAG